MSAGFKLQPTVLTVGIEMPETNNRFNGLSISKNR